MSLEFKDRFLQVLENAGCSKSAAAVKLKVSPAYITQLSSGLRSPSDRTISDICRVFGCDEVWLRTGAGEPFTPLSRSDELAAIFEKVEIGTDEKSRLIRAMARMPDEAFPALLQFVQQLYQNFIEE